MDRRPWIACAAEARGFTFIELMFVLVTIGILMAAVVPRLGPSLDRLQTERVAFEAAAMLRYAQALAVRERAPVYVTLREADGGRRQLVLSLEPEGEPVADRFARSRPLPPGVEVAVEPPPGADADEAPLAFLPDGTAQPAVVSVSDRQHDAYRIIIDETTGHVSVGSGAPAR